MFGHYLDLLGRSPFVCAGVYPASEGLAAAIVMPRGRDGMGGDRLLHVPPSGVAASRPLLEPKNVLYSESNYFDIANIWKERTALFNDKQVKQLEKFEKQSAPFLVGSKLSKLLTQAGPYYRFVAAHQTKVGYKTTPKISIPAFALVWELREPEAFGKSMEAILRGAALLAGGQVNLKLVEEKYKDCKLVGYRFPEDQPLKGDINDLRFNFTPCFTRVGDQFVVSSTLDLCRELVDILHKEGTTPTRGRRFVGACRFYGSGAAAYLQSIEDLLITQTTLDQAITPKEARRAGQEVARPPAWQRARSRWSRVSTTRRFDTTFDCGRRNDLDNLVPRRSLGTRRSSFMANASQKPLDPRWAWQPYRPSKEAPWNLQRVGHLYRRAAFGATPAELEDGRKAGPEALIAQLLKGGPGLAEFDAQMAPLAHSIARYNDAGHLRAWWLTRMLHSPHPLQEKITLFWHNHFATSYAKVQSARFMLGQYELMRRHALGNFAELLREMSSDPAMLIWLDGRNSKKGNPNENYGRELMELFSLGIGHYTEQDIRQAARAFTGWEIQGTKAAFNKSQHDNGDKTVLGQTGNWSADDIVRICLEQKSARAVPRPQAVPLSHQRDGGAECGTAGAVGRAIPLERLRLRRWSRRCFRRTCSSRRWFIGRASNRRSISC